MNRPPVAVRPAVQTARLQQPPSPKLPLTDFIRRQLVTVAERDQQRSRLVNVLIVALALLTIGRPAAPDPWYTRRTTSCAEVRRSILGAIASERSARGVP